MYANQSKAMISITPQLCKGLSCVLSTELENARYKEEVPSVGSPVLVNNHMFHANRGPNSRNQETLEASMHTFAGGFLIPRKCPSGIVAH